MLHDANYDNLEDPEYRGHTCRSPAPQLEYSQVFRLKRNLML